MSATGATHLKAVQSLISDPTNPALARRVLELALDEPERAAEARNSFALPAPQPLPLDITHRRYDRHNLHMPDSPARIAAPDQLPDLVKTLQDAAGAWSPTKAIGDGYGFANTGFTRGVLIPMVSNLDSILALDTGVLRDGVDSSELVQFEAGATIERLNAHLWDKGKCLLNQPGFEKLTFAGTMSSGGHGSGTWVGPLSEHVVSVHLLTIDKNRNVAELRIEPKNGITNPAKFAAKFPKIELIQDDDMFRSCTCAMGCLGVIYALTVKVQPRFSVRETRTKLSWSAVKGRLPQLLAEQGPGKRLHSIEIWVNPYPVGGDVHCVLGEREWTDAPPQGHRGLGVLLGGSMAIFHLVSWFAQHFPDTLPALIDSALDTTQASGVVMPAPEGLNFGPPNLVPVDAASGAVASAGVGATVDALLGLFLSRAQSGSGWLTSPFGLRFCKAAEAHMSPSFQRDTCMIEVPTFQGTPGARATLRAYHDFIYQNDNGRPHWGQINDMPGERLEHLYPNLPKFLESYRVLNPKGFFDNAFTEQMGFRLRS